MGCIFSLDQYQNNLSHWTLFATRGSYQFLQAFFFLAAPSPQLAALREEGSGFFKSSSSRRASVSTRSWTRSKVNSALSGATLSFQTLTWDCEPTTSSSLMSLADSDHIFTVLGSRAGFSADITGWKWYDKVFWEVNWQLGGKFLADVVQLLTERFLLACSHWGDWPLERFLHTGTEFTRRTLHLI